MPSDFIANKVTLSIADMITVSSVSSLTLVFNCILSSRLLGEKLTKFDFFSSVLISVGAMICVAFSSLEQSKNSYDVRRYYISEIKIGSCQVLYLKTERSSVYICHSLHASLTSHGPQVRLSNVTQSIVFSRDSWGSLTRLSRDGRLVLPSHPINKI
jgi:hypothetical protein